MRKVWWFTLQSRTTLTMTDGAATCRYIRLSISALDALNNGATGAFVTQALAKSRVPMAHTKMSLNCR